MYVCTHMNTQPTRNWPISQRGHTGLHRRCPAATDRVGRVGGGDWGEGDLNCVSATLPCAGRAACHALCGVVDLLVTRPPGQQLVKLACAASAASRERVQGWLRKLKWWAEGALQYCCVKRGERVSWIQTGSGHRPILSAVAKLRHTLGSSIVCIKRPAHVAAPAPMGPDAAEN